MHQTKSCAENEGDIRAVPQQKLQVQAIDHVEEIASDMCSLFRTGHRASLCDFASNDSPYQFSNKLLDKGGMDYASSMATLNSATTGSLEGSNRGKYSNRL
jgi:hypothetical protein